MSETLTYNYDLPDFDYYIRHGEPEQKQRAINWSIAIGLQQVDRLQVSEYLRFVARQNIEGDITITQAQEQIANYYASKDSRAENDDDTEEADRVSTNISSILAEPTFSFSFLGLTAIHRRLFDHVFKFAGKIRDYNITKREWILDGDTVRYVSAFDLKETIEYDLEQESKFSYSGLTTNQIISHIAKFISGLWQIHPFGEGNTRTTAIFTIKYLQSMGFDVNNELFAEHSWYFRNALVRANYKNVQKGIDYSPIFLEVFFRNLLLGENNELKNRFLHIRWTEPIPYMSSISNDYNVPTTTTYPTTHPTTHPTTYPTSTEPKQKNINKITTDNFYVISLIRSIGNQQLSVKEILDSMSLKDRKNLIDLYISPAISGKYIKLLYADKPNHPRQKYMLTTKGYALLDIIK